MNKAFHPTHIPFADGQARIAEALKRAGRDMKDGILTSRDKAGVELCNLLAVPAADLPKGFTKWQLPFWVEGGQFFITAAQAGAEVGEHAHDDDGVRFIVSGSVHFDGQELGQGDWMYIPKGSKYSLKVGPMGALMCYCYCCCCAGRSLNNHDPVINPGTYARPRLRA